MTIDELNVDAVVDEATLGLELLVLPLLEFGETPLAADRNDLTARVLHT